MENAGSEHLVGSLANRSVTFVAILQSRISRKPGAHSFLNGFPLNGREEVLESLERGEEALGYI